MIQYAIRWKTIDSYTGVAEYYVTDINNQTFYFDCHYEFTEWLYDTHNAIFDVESDVTYDEQFLKQGIELTWIQI